MLLVMTYWPRLDDFNRCVYNVAINYICFSVHRKVLAQGRPVQHALADLFLCILPFEDVDGPGASFFSVQKLLLTITLSVLPAPTVAVPGGRTQNLTYRNTVSHHSIGRDTFSGSCAVANVLFPSTGCPQPRAPDRCMHELENIILILQ